MRKFQFRAWVPDQKLMIQPCYAEIYSDGSYHVGQLPGHLGTINDKNDNIVLMQSIGVLGYEGIYLDRHKNEVDLYEGDIVEAMSEGVKGRFVIQFRQEAQPTFILYPAWQGGKTWSISASKIGRKDGRYYDDLRRIGNIYENPELMAGIIK